MTTADWIAVTILGAALAFYGFLWLYWDRRDQPRAKISDLKRNPDVPGV